MENNKYKNHICPFCKGRLHLQLLDGNITDAFCTACKKDIALDEILISENDVINQTHKWQKELIDRVVKHASLVVDEFNRKSSNTVILTDMQTTEEKEIT